MTQEKLLKAAGLGHEISAREAWKLFGIMAEFFEATERLSDIRPAVSVFGSARARPGTLYYRWLRGRRGCFPKRASRCSPAAGRRHGGRLERRPAARAALEPLPACEPAL